MPNRLFFGDFHVACRGEPSGKSLHAIHFALWCRTLPSTQALRALLSDAVGNSRVPAGRHHSRLGPSHRCAGVVRHVYEAVYVKVLAPDSNFLRPLPENLTPRVKALFDHLFGQ